VIAVGDACVIRPQDNGRVMIGDVGAQESNEGKDDVIEVEDQDDELEAGQRKMQNLQDSMKPSADELTEHNLTHLPL
jgi:hypothetical protein